MYNKIKIKPNDNKDIVQNHNDNSNTINISNNNNEKNSEEEKNKKAKEEKKYYFIWKTYTSRKTPFNFESFKFLHGIIFFLLTIFLPFLINIIVTYAMPEKSDDSNQRLAITVIGWLLTSIALIYLWVIYGKKFVKMGGLIPFYFMLFLPVFTIIGGIFILNTPFYKHLSEDNQIIVQTLIQVVGEIICVVLIFVTTKDLFKRVINTYKDGWYYILTVIIGLAGLYVLNSLLNLIPIDSFMNFHSSLISSSFLTSDNQNELNKLLNTTGGIIVLGFFTILVAPFMEELTTRHGIFQISSNKWLGLVAATIYFAGMHVADSGDWQHILDYLGASLALSFAFLFANGNVAYTVTIHSISNIVAYVVTIFQHFHSGK